jgi:isocitrate dehydrogenase
MKQAIIPIAVAYGDGIGPEIVTATLKILKEAKVPIRVETIEVGEKLYKKLYKYGISDEVWSVISRTKAFLKGPITTPQGGGYRSLNVTFRKRLGLYSNVRPVESCHPFLKTVHEKTDIVVIRENEEDIYLGLEYRSTNQVHKAVKLLTIENTFKIVKYAFEYAKMHNRKKVTCITKDNILKLTDGTFHKIFKTIAKEYPDIESDHLLVDIGTAKIASKPEQFDVIVTNNLYGDIISDVTAEICGSVGLAGSANIGLNYGMFEAVHGSAPDIADKNIANPSGIINAAVMMLSYLGLSEHASLISNAWKKTIEDGIHTADIFDSGNSARQVKTLEFADAVVERLGQGPKKLSKSLISTGNIYIDTVPANKEKKVLVGVDVFLSSTETLDQVVEKINQDDNLKLDAISVKALKVWPDTGIQDVNSHFLRCRFLSKQQSLDYVSIIRLFSRINTNGIEILSSENLYTFDGVEGFSDLYGTTN